MLKYSKWAGYVLGLFMIFMGVQKFIGDVPIFVILEDNLAAKTGIKLGFIEPYLKYITAVLELIAGALLLFGKRLAGGLLSIIIIGGAIFLHLTIIGINTPETSAADANHSPVLFIMAVVFFLVSLWVTQGARRASALTT